MTIDPHFREHDPILDANHCERCNAALRHTLVLLADMDLGPKDATTLAKRIREIALGLEPERYTVRNESYGYIEWRPTEDGLVPVENVVAPEFIELRSDPENPYRTLPTYLGEIDAEIDIPLPPR
jgi:hypothetical protein